MLRRKQGQPRVLMLAGTHSQAQLAGPLARLGFDIAGVATADAAIDLLLDGTPVDLLVLEFHQGMEGALRLLGILAAQKRPADILTLGSMDACLYSPTRQFLRLTNLNDLGEIELPIDEPRLARAIGRCQAADRAGSAFPSDQAVQAALANHAISPKFEPKIDLLSGQVYGFELLARCDGIGTDLLIPRLERLGLLDAMLFSLLRQGSRFIEALGRADLEIAFNASPAQVGAPDFPRRLCAVLSECLPGQRRITVELTETSDLPATALANLRELRQRGLGLALDDFGSGYSSLRRLCELPFSEIKLDRHFSARLNDDPKCRKVVRASIELARALALPLVLEGVETREQMETLAALGGRLAQGYLFTRPLQGHELRAFLDSWRAVPLAAETHRQGLPA